MMNANSHFGTFKCSLIMYTISYIYVAHYLNNKVCNQDLEISLSCRLLVHRAENH